MQMKRQYLLIPLLALVACGSGKEEGQKPWGEDIGPKNEPAATGYQVGEVLPAWEKGYLDIHAINSGRGECILYILPDGTTMLVDAGEVAASAESIQRKPNAGTCPYVTYSRYVRHFLPVGKKKLDYMYLTHFHIDHMGEDNSATPRNAHGYRTVGVSGVFEEVGFTTLLDRGYPGYGDDPTILKPESTATDNYIRFVKWATAETDLKVERIEVGSASQVRLLSDPSYDCKVLNIIGNGQYVAKDANGKSTVERVNIDAENPASCGFHLTYGKFDCIACGDLTSGPQNRMANYYRDFVGSLEVFKTNHHLSANSWGTQMQKVAFSPRIILNEAFSNYQPDKGILNSIFTGVFPNNTYTWTKDLFLTNAHEDLLRDYPDLYGKCHYNGHIVIRVEPGGGQFMIYMLDDSNFEYKIKSIHGPYKCN